MSKEKSASQILKKRARHQSGATLVRLVKWSLFMAFFLMLMGATAMVGIYFYLSDDLPKITSLTDYHPSIITTVYSDDNRKIAEFYKERRIVVPLSKIPI
ncbi:MAG: penicillin-binding protein, partial [Desulfosarcina sp.]|nr:penicillin-binding protein [Desulfosarcina sp.]MDX2492728.1 penicillin-binding protein [Desulfosarcina sp.]